MINWKLYTLGGVVFAVITIIAYNTPYWNETCSAINRILMHNGVGDVFECGGDDNLKKGNVNFLEQSKKMQEIIEQYSNNHIIRQLPRDLLVTIIESHRFDQDTVTHVADKILNYKPETFEISRAYHLRQQLSKLPAEYMSTILKYEFHPNVVDKVMSSADLMVTKQKPLHGAFDLAKLGAKLSIIVPSAKDYYDTIPDNSEMCDHDRAVTESGIMWVYCVCLKGAPKSRKNYVALRIKPTIDSEVMERKDTFICTASFYTECVKGRGCYGYEPIKRVTPPQEINLGAITEENFALWKTLENQHMNTNGELSFGAEVNCLKKPAVTVITE